MVLLVEAPPESVPAALTHTVCDAREGRHGRDVSTAWTSALLKSIHQVQNVLQVAAGRGRSALGDACRYGQQILQRGRGGECMGLPDSAAALRVCSDEVSDGAVVLHVDFVGGRTGSAR